MFVAAEKVVASCCLWLVVLWGMTPAVCGAWSLPTCQRHPTTTKRLPQRPIPSFLRVASPRETTYAETRYYDSLPLNDTTATLSVFEAGIESQWRTLQEVNKENGNRATFSIPREVPRGTHSIEASYGIHETQGTDEEMAAAMDLILRAKEEEDEQELYESDGRYVYGGPMSIALDSATAALKALAFVLRETATIIEEPDQSSIVRYSKISRGFQGIFELGREFVRSFFSMMALRSSTAEEGTRPVTYSATLPVVDHSSLEPSEAEEEVEVSRNPTISLSLDEATEIWGYEGTQQQQQQQREGNNKWKKIKSNFGLWRDHVVHSTATTASSMSEKVGQVPMGVAAVCDNAVNATIQFQKSITNYCDMQEKKNENNKKKRQRKQKQSFGRRGYHTDKPAAFYFATKSASRSVYPTTTARNNTSTMVDGGEAFYFMTENGLF